MAPQKAVVFGGMDILVGVGMSVVKPMVACPPQGASLNCCGTQNGEGKLAPP
jgi:hypothetical protein